MDLRRFKKDVEDGQMDAAESAWNLAVEAGAPVAGLAAALETLVAAGQGDLAEMLGWTLLTQRAEQASPQESLNLAKAILSAVPTSEELRMETFALYEKIFGKQEAFETVAGASGLLSGLPPRRGLRTLDTCLAVAPGSYLANRFDHRVLRVEKFDPAAAAFATVDAAGGPVLLDPLAVGDEYDLVNRADFRVLAQHFPQELTGLMESDPAGVLVGMCLSHGGQIDSGELKDGLVPRFLAADRWSGWWNRARTAARRCRQLSLEGRNPVVVTYHAQGRSLEEELAPAVAAATMPLDRLAVLRQYARQARERKVSLAAAFAGAIMESLAEQARAFQADRPADALAAALAIDAAVRLNMPAPRQEYPNPGAVLVSASRPAEAVAALEDFALWPAALEAMQARSDRDQQLRALLYQAPAEVLDQVAQRLLGQDAGSAPPGAARAANEQAVAEAVALALAEPVAHLELLLWLWKGPSPAPSGLPGKVDLLSRLLGTLQEIDHDWNVEAERRKAIRHRVRATLAAGDYAAFRQAVSAMEEPVAGTIKGRIERCVGLAQAVREDMLNILRENFYALFAKAKPAAWLDESTIWTTEAALRRRQAALKELVDVKMLENSRAIGAAAEHGDLSENSEWKFALEERDLLRARVAQMQQELALARVLRPEDVPPDSVGVGARVLLKRLADGAELEMTFLGPWETDVSRNIYYYRTPLAADLMGKTVGDVVSVKIEGAEGEYRIDRISSALGPVK